MPGHVFKGISARFIAYPVVLCDVKSRRVLTRLSCHVSGQVPHVVSLACNIPSITPCRLFLCHRVCCPTISCYASLFSCHVMSCYLFSCHVVSCHVMSRGTTCRAKSSGVCLPWRLALKAVSCPYIFDVDVFFFFKDGPVLRPATPPNGMAPPGAGPETLGPSPSIRLRKTTSHPSPGGGGVAMRRINRALHDEGAVGP